MDWELQLIKLYDYVDHHYHKELWVYSQRFSNNSRPEFSDVEVLVIYLFGLMKKHRELVDIYRYTRDHFLAYFPKLPSYQNYVRRLNALCDIFGALIEKIFSDYLDNNMLKPMKLIDSMPIMMANAKRSNRARVAKEFANKGYPRFQGYLLLWCKAACVGSQTGWHIASCRVCRFNPGQ